MSDDSEKKTTGLLPGAVRGLKNLVVENEDSIVSRTLYRSESGSLTLFAFAEGQRLSEHTAPFDAIVQVVEGEAEITIDGASHAVGAGEVILMPAHVPHAVHAKRGFTFLLTMFKRS